MMDVYRIYTLYKNPLQLRWTKVEQTPRWHSDVFFTILAYLSKKSVEHSFIIINWWILKEDNYLGYVTKNKT